MMKTKEGVCNASQLSVKRIILSIFFLLVLCRTAGAQDARKGILSAADAGTCTANSTACSFLTVPSGSGGVTFTITTNASANTIQFEATGDTEPTGSHTWVALNVFPSNSTVAVTSTTSTGTWQANIAGFTQVRLRMSTFVGGTTTTYINLSTASARAGGGGGTSAFGPNYSVGGGTAQAQTVAPTTPVTNATLVNGYQICWLPNAANSGPAPTLAGSGTSTFSAKSITKYGTIALIANDIVTSTVACAVYDGTEFQLQMPKAGSIQTTSYQAVGAAAQAMNLYVAGGCDGILACTGNFWGLQAPASLAASLQYTPPIVDGAAGDGLTTDGSQHMAWAIQRRTLTGTAYTNATTTFSNVVGSAGQTLQFTVAASSNYKIACDIEWQGSANTTGPKWQWTGPASPTALVQYAHNPVTTSTYLDAVGSKTAFSSPMADTGTITAATDFVSHLDLELVNGVNAGTVVLQAAANGVGTLTIQPGSSCISNGDK